MRVVDVQTFNYLVIGVDSVSRLNFARHMPHTRRFLLEELGAVELAGFNKVNKHVVGLVHGLLVVLCVCRSRAPWFSV